MEIKYEYDGYCLTSCPFGFMPMVGSTACAKCKYHISKDAKNMTVCCNRDERRRETRRAVIVAVVGAVLAILVYCLAF